MSIPSDNNLHKTAKYSDLAMLMKLTYSPEQIVIITVIISISGLISLESKSALEHIVEETDIVKMISIIQKTALLDTVIMRSVLLKD